MSVAFRQIKLYFKLVIIGSAVLVIGLTLFQNRDNTASVWFFKEYADVNVLKLMLLTAVAAIIGFWMLVMAFRLWKEWRRVSKQAAEKKRTKQLDQRIKELEQDKPSAEPQATSLPAQPADDTTESGHSG